MLFVKETPNVTFSCFLFIIEIILTLSLLSSEMCVTHFFRIWSWNDTEQKQRSVTNNIHKRWNSRKNFQKMFAHESNLWNQRKLKQLCLLEKLLESFFKWGYSEQFCLHFVVVEVQLIRECLNFSWLWWWKLSRKEIEFRVSVEVSP